MKKTSIIGFLTSFSFLIINFGYALSYSSFGSLGSCTVPVDLEGFVLNIGNNDINQNTLDHCQTEIADSLDFKTVQKIDQIYNNFFDSKDYQNTDKIVYLLKIKNKLPEYIKKLNNDYERNVIKYLGLHIDQSIYRLFENKPNGFRKALEKFFTFKGDTFFSGSIGKDISEGDRKNLGHGYETDGKDIYYNGNLVDINLDIDSFESFGYGLIRDKDNVYFISTKLEDLDVDSFKFIDKADGWVYSKDKNNVYTRSRKIIDANPKSFEVLSNPKFAIDDNYVFYKGKKLKNITSKQFRALQNSSLNIEDINSNSFNDSNDSTDSNGADYKYTSNNSKTLGSGYAFDKENVYWSKDLINVADRDSFKDLGNGYAKDKNYIYYRGNPLDGKGLENFQNKINKLALDENEPKICETLSKQTNIQECKQNTENQIEKKLNKTVQNAIDKDDISECQELNQSDMIEKCESQFNGSFKELGSGFYMISNDDKRYPKGCNSDNLKKSYEKCILHIKELDMLVSPGTAEGENKTHSSKKLDSPYQNMYNVRETSGEAYNYCNSLNIGQNDWTWKLPNSSRGGDNKYDELRAIYDNHNKLQGLDIYVGHRSSMFYEIRFGESYWGGRNNEGRFSKYYDNKYNVRCVTEPPKELDL